MKEREPAASTGSRRLLRSGRWPNGIVGYLVALAAVAVVSLFIGLVLGQVNLANSSMLYLLAVLATAVAFGRGPAVLASVAAFLVFDWFFVHPLHQFTVADPEEWVSLVFFLLTATVTGQLAAGQRQRAQEARQREREALVLYDVVRMLGDGELEQVLEAVAERLRREMNLVAVAVELTVPTGGTLHVGAGEPGTVRRLELGSGSAGRVLQGGQAAASDDHVLPGRWVRVVHPRPNAAHSDVQLVPVRVGQRRVGALLMVASGEFDSAEDRLLSAAAAQIGLALERDRLRKQATEAEILRRTDQLRTTLLNAVSHDLRTPLAAIMASAGSLRQQDVEWTDQERLEFAQAIEEEAQRLDRLVGNLLDLSRIQAGSLHPERSWHDLGALIEDVVDRLRLVTARHRVHVTAADGLPAIWLDPVEIGQVLYNLLENAAKYAPAGTPIDVDVRREGGCVSVAVTDRGPGVPASALPRLFDPFYRVIDGQPRPKGLGLGLAIVKGLVEAHGGRVGVENRIDGGARFTFTLPLVQSRVTPPPAEVGVA